MNRSKDLLHDLELTLTPEERAERREQSEVETKREESLAQLRAFRPVHTNHNNDEERNH